MGKVDHFRIFLVLCSAFLISMTTPVFSQPIKPGNNLFFTRDVFLFAGKPFSSPPLHTVLPISQQFRSTCSNMNRFILAFDVKDRKPSGRLAFQLFQKESPDTPLYIEVIDTSKFPSPRKMGSHFLKGIFHTIWIPIQENSKNSDYSWTLSQESKSLSNKLGLYLTKYNSRQVSILTGSNLPPARAAFYTFCQYRFDWGEVIRVIGQRLRRESGFWVTFLILIAGNTIWIFRADSRP